MGKLPPKYMTLDEAGRTPVRGVRVGFHLRWSDDPQRAGELVWTDHPTGSSWEETKRGVLVIRDRKRKQVGRYAQFHWQQVSS